MTFTRVILGSTIAATLAAVPALAQEHQHPAGERLGTVKFQTSCTPPAQEKFHHALALLHSFEFGPAIQDFTAAAQADSRCAIAHWGIALARWTNPFQAAIRPPAQLQQGADAIALARKADARTEREKDYIEAAATLYTDAATRDQRTRVLAYEQAMSKLAAKYPDDHEASIFWALSLTASALPTDKTYANQMKAGAILETLYPLEPDHPGITHYIIHSYDVPALADHAIAAAHRYAKIAPAAPHALHMPSHTFTRVGAWQDSIDTNIASADSARKVNARGEELHAMDYMTYAYLQTGQDKAVQAMLEKIPEIAAVFDPTKVQGAAPGSAGIFALAAMPARWALERRDWKTAASLRPSPSQFPHTEAITYFARALGASHTGALDDARASVSALQQISDKLAAANEAYWAEQVRIQHDGAAAFLALAEGKKDEAVKLMTEAAIREDATDKNAVTPGPIAPARELLGEMLLELKRPADALKEFQATMKKEPNRFRAVYGAAKAASLAGDQASARKYYAELLKIAAKADTPGRPELVEARKEAR
jgi:hypothetical protein